MTRLGRPTTAVLIAPALALALAIAVPGCGDGLKPRYPVSGKVTYKGQPVPKGTVTFAPADGEGEGAFGQIIDGGYRLTTRTTNDGAVPGRYRVSIVSAEVTTPEAALDTNPNATPEAAVAKAQRTAKHRIPTKYANADTSGLTGEVKAQSNAIDFNLSD
jgi:hypothetical protein